MTSHAHVVQVGARQRPAAHDYTTREHHTARKPYAAHGHPTAPEIHPLGPKNCADRDSAPHPTVASAPSLTTRDAEPVGGLRGAALAPPKL